MTSQAFGGVNCEFTLRLTPHQKVAPLHWRSDTHTHKENMHSSAARPNYISQDEDDNPTPDRRTTRSQSIMQEAMLSCINITNPT